MTSIVEHRSSIDADALLFAMQVEERLLAELSRALAGQRDGIARDDSTAVDTATHQVSRAVMTLDQARRRREQITQLLGAGDLLPLDQIESRVGPIPGLTERRRALRTAAQATVRDLALNQSILRGALRAGDAYLQALFASVGDGAPNYTRAAPVGSTAGSGVVINRRA